MGLALRDTGARAAAAAAPLLEVRGLDVRHGKVPALRGEGIRVERGEIVTVIGPNGAGKTTLLSTVAGLIPRAAGEVLLDGAPVAGAAVEEDVARGLALVPETRELFAGMTVEDNLLLGAFTLGRRRRREVAALLDEVSGIFPRRAGRRGQLAGTLSGGERHRLALGRALMSKPRLLLLDEPSLGLAPLVVREIPRHRRAAPRRRLDPARRAERPRGAADLRSRVRARDREVSLSGPARALADDPRIVETYLGGSRGAVG